MKPFCIPSVGGPFYIVGGKKKEPLYWTIMEFNNKNCLFVTDDKDEAVVFSVEKTAIQNEFQIAYYGENKESAYYVNIDKARIDSFISGREEGPLRISGGGKRSPANFILCNENDERCGTDTWEKIPLFVRIAPRRMTHRSYLALDERYYMMRVPTRDGQDMKNIRFKLERVPIKDRNKSDGYFAPTLYSKPPPGLLPIEEGDDPEFDFEFEFEPVPESEEPEAPAN